MMLHNDEGAQSMEANSHLTWCGHTPSSPAWPSVVSSGTPPRGPCTLAVIPRAAIRLHEDYDTSRAMPLVQAMARDGVQCHPVIVAREPGNVLLHLDGANRLTALAQLQCPHVVAQVVEYADPQVELTTWVHLTRLAQATLQQDAEPWPAQHLETVAAADVSTILTQERCVAVVIDARGTALAVYSGMGLL